MFVKAISNSLNKRWSIRPFSTFKMLHFFCKFSINGLSLYLHFINSESTSIVKFPAVGWRRNAQIDRICRGAARRIQSLDFQIDELSVAGYKMMFANKISDVRVEPSVGLKAAVKFLNWRWLKSE